MKEKTITLSIPVLILVYALITDSLYDCMPYILAPYMVKT